MNGVSITRSPSTVRVGPTSSTETGPACGVGSSDAKDHLYPLMIRFMSGPVNGEPSVWTEKRTSVDWPAARWIRANPISWRTPGTSHAGNRAYHVELHDFVTTPGPVVGD